MKVIGLMFSLIGVVMLMFFGMGAVTETIDNANITAADANYDNFVSAQNTTTMAFSVGGVIPYILILAAVIAALLAFTTLLRR
jgi:hypothetical protein